MSDPATDPTIDDNKASNADIEAHLSSLSDNATSMLNYTPDGAINAAASVRYLVTGTLDLDIDTDWQPFDTLTLNNVHFHAALSKSSREGSVLHSCPISS